MKATIIAACLAVAAGLGSIAAHAEKEYTCICDGKTVDRITCRNVEKMRCDCQKKKAYCEAIPR